MKTWRCASDVVLSICQMVSVHSFTLVCSMLLGEAWIEKGSSNTGLILTMQQEQGCLSKSSFSPGSTISSTSVRQLQGLLILPCPEEILGLLIQGDRLKHHHLCMT